MLLHSGRNILTLVVGFVVFAAVFQTKILACNTVAEALVSPLAQIRGVEEVGHLAVEPILMLGGIKCLFFGKFPEIFETDVTPFACILQMFLQSLVHLAIALFIHMRLQ